MIQNINAYTLEQEQALPEVNGTGYVFRHNKTKARILVIQNDDINKVFAIGFRTPPTNSKGIQHIIEHTVLCGSKKYPAKDPFVELAKGSLNTFLNAMTYSDKTVYPVASCNDKDFRNLTDVYLDAVFHPNIYDKEEIFMQEGWHYELADADSPLIYNGVVFNEMKGVYSSPDSVISRSVGKCLFPDSVYRHDSGGDPKDIPALTREEYLDYHSKYYHPSNSYIYLYGNVDIAEQLEYLDREYLSQYDHLELDSSIALQQAPDQVIAAEVPFALAEGEEPSENAFLTYNAVIGTSLDKKLRVAFDVLAYVLLDAEGAPVTKAIIDAGLAADVESSYDTSMLQPVFSIVAHNADAERKDEFRSLLTDTLAKLAEEGLDRTSLRAAIRRFEFSHKEGDFGRYPKGLMLGLDAFETWLYDDEKALELFSMNEVYEALTAAVDTGYFEQLIKTYLLDNHHVAFITGIPEIGRDSLEEAEVQSALAEKKDSLLAEEKEAIVRETEHLKEYQGEPSPAEDLEKIPLLAREDIDREERKLCNRFSEIDGTELVTHPLFTNGIEYLDFFFDLSDLTTEEIRLAALLAELYKSVPTEHFTLEELTTEMNLRTGGISVTTGFIPNAVQDSDSLRYMLARVKTLEGEMPGGIELLTEVLERSKISDKKRLGEIIAELYSGLRSDLPSSGHITSALRARSYIAGTYCLKDEMEGLGYYRFISGLNSDFENRYEKLAEQLNALQEKILQRSRVKISYTHKEMPKENVEQSIRQFLGTLSDAEMGEKAAYPEPVKKNEGMITAGQVQYVAAAWDFGKEGLPFTGALHVLQIIFSYDYLWINVRVKGGAYGAMCDFTRDGIAFLTSYRDPNLTETLEIYKHAEDYVREFDCSDRDMLKYIIGTISKIDTPMNPATEGLVSFYAYLNGRTDADRQKSRDEVLAVDQTVIRGLAPYLAGMARENAIAVVGSKSKVEGAGDVFGTVENLL
ncbi:MAG: insulinase family protein [Eubacterium sp.]|nr:insulinase family protein [Eubacterium sp.]